MKTVMPIGLLLAALLGSTLPGFGQGSMSRFTTAAQNTIGWDKRVSSSPTNALTISARRDFDYGVALTASSATRYWFQDISAQSEALVAAGRYQNATLWAQAPSAIDPVSANNRGALIVHARSLNLQNSRYPLGTSATGFAASQSRDEDAQITAWLGNIGFANVDPTRKGRP